MIAIDGYHCSHRALGVLERLSFFPSGLSLVIVTTFEILDELELIRVLRHLRIGDESNTRER